jgi:uncharacterized protein YdhG (YjbR/CyaY superfamily)
MTWCRRVAYAIAGVKRPAGGRIGEYPVTEQFVPHETPMPAPASQPATIDEYIAACPADVRAILQKIRTTIRTAAPDATEAIKYRIPTFVLGGNLVHFAAFDQHIGFYPTPSGIAAFRDELAAYPSAKGSVQFPLTGAVPYGLIRKVVKFRVQEVRAKAGKAKKK